MSKLIETDVLIIGSGFAGLLAAVKLIEAGASVVLASKTHLPESNTNYAQGGIAAATDKGSSEAIKSHLEDTLKAGAGLVDIKAAEEIIASGWQLIKILKEYGVAFDHLANGAFALAREGGHSAARVYHYQDTTGKSISHGLINKLKALQAKAKEHGQLQIYENKLVYSLVMGNGICHGAKFISNEGKDSSDEKEITTVLAAHTILATGGIGQIFSRTTNPIVATGDGIALAYLAGAQLIDMEFVQFHPTALYLENQTNSPAFLISEAVRGAGAILLDHNHNRFMTRFHLDAELATRDIVARAIDQVMKETKQKSVYIDLRPIGKEILERQFPNILHRLRDLGIDAMNEPVPVCPAAHYFMGGIKADCTGRTSIPFLYAIGECAATGLHGANRLASNSLLEAGVMALKVAESIAQQSEHTALKKSDKAIHCDLMPAFTKPSNLPAVRQCMSHDVGIIRNAQSLEAALHLFKDNLLTNNYSVENLQAANILLLAELITQSALRREESRGSHFRSDFENTSDKFAARQIIHKDGYSWVTVANASQTAK